MGEEIFSHPTVRTARALALLRATPIRLVTANGLVVARIHPDGRIERSAPIPLEPLILEWEEEE